MSDMPMPRDLTEEAVAEWLFDTYRGRLPDTGAYQSVQWDPCARAVLALVEAKVTAAVNAARCAPLIESDESIIARVMGKDGAKRGSDEGRQARGEVKRG